MSVPPHSFPDFSNLARSLILFKNKLDQRTKDFKKDAQEIRQYYSPRAKFERWKATEDGKVWKEKQHKHQQGCCASCDDGIQVKGSHIDHIQPLSKFPELAISMKNLRLLCPDCNTKKGSNDWQKNHLRRFLICYLNDRKPSTLNSELRAFTQMINGLKRFTSEPRLQPSHQPVGYSPTHCHTKRSPSSILK